MSTAENSPRAILDGVEALRARTRAERPRMSIPLLLVSILMFGAMPFYLLRPLGDTGWWSSSRLWALAGDSGVDSPNLAALYWIIAVPACFALVVAYVSWRGNRSGVKIQTRTWVIVGVSLFLATLIDVYTPDSRRLAGDLFGRGLVPLLTISAAVLVWGLAVRSVDLVLVSVIGLAASVVANLYNVENLMPARTVDYRYNLIVNIALPAIVFLTGSVVIAVARGRSRR